jgi:hypothetical protein
MRSTPHCYAVLRRGDAAPPGSPYFYRNAKRWLGD